MPPSTTEFPKTMHHPHYRKGTATAVKGVDHATGSGRPYTDYQGTPDRMPPLFVENSEQEERARSRGYLQFGEAPPAMHEGTEYPLMMVHPQHVDAVPDDKVPHKDGDGPVTIVVVKGTPERFPHAIVNNASEEAAWRAKGYDRPGVSDPAAVEASKANPYDPDRPPGQEWPKMVQTGVGPDGKAIMTLMQDPSIQVETQQYPKWITTGKDANGDPTGVTVNNRGEELVILEKHGLLVVAAPAPVERTPDDQSTVIAADQRVQAWNDKTQAAMDSDDPLPTLRPMTHGEKIAAGRARKKAERQAAQSAA